MSMDLFLCSKCNQERPRDEFYWAKQGWRQTGCKDCRRRPIAASAVCQTCDGAFIPRSPNAKYCSKQCRWKRDNQTRDQRAHADYMRAYNRRKAQEKHGHKDQRQCLNCSGPIPLDMDYRAKYCSKKCGYAHYDKHRDRPNRNEQAFTRKWGLTIEQRDELLARQDGCAICHTWDPSGGMQRKNGSGWAIDHDHSCCPDQRSCGMCIRGILCSNCNCGIGLLGDNAKRLQQAAQYLLTGNSQ